MAWELGDDDLWEEQLPDPDPRDGVSRDFHPAYQNPRPWYLQHLDYTEQDEWLVDQRTRLYLSVIRDNTWSHAWREIGSMNRFFRLPRRVRGRLPSLLPIHMMIETAGSDVETPRTAYLIRGVPLVTWSLSRDTQPVPGTPALVAHAWGDPYFAWSTEWEARNHDIGNLLPQNMYARRSAQLVNVNNLMPDIFDVTYNAEGLPLQYCRMVHDRQSTMSIVAWIESFGAHQDWMHVRRAFADRHFAARIEHDV